MMKHYTVDKDRIIGNVIFVVEGGSPNNDGTELRLLKKVFTDVLGYEVLSLRRGTEEFIGYGNNHASRVFALNLPKNQLTQLTEDAMDILFQRLKDEFSIKPEDCPIFLLYDRDYKSYAVNELRGRYVRRYTNPYANDEGYQGQLLLSYPAVESYILSCFEDDVFEKRYLLGVEAKVELIQKGISEEDIIEEQQKIVKENDHFSALSLISMALLELGVIVECEEE